MKVYEQITDLIGATPLVKLKNYSANRELDATILAKVEYFNTLRAALRTVLPRLCWTTPKPRA